VCVNRSGKLRIFVLVLVSGGLLFLVGLGVVVRSCTNRFRSADHEQYDTSRSENPVAGPSRTVVRSLEPVGANPGSGFRAPKLQRGLIEQHDIIQPVDQPVDAGAGGGTPPLTDEEVRALEARRDLSDKDKQKLRQRRR